MDERLSVTFCRQPAASGHHGGGDEEEGRQRLADQQERQGGANGALGVGVAVDALAVGHEAEQQQDDDVFGQREALAEGHGIGRGQDGGAWGCDTVGNFS